MRFVVEKNEAEEDTEEDNADNNEPELTSTRQEAKECLENIEVFSECSSSAIAAKFNSLHILEVFSDRPSRQLTQSTLDSYLQ